MRSAFGRALNRALPEPHASFAAGLVLGEKRGIPQDLLDDFKLTGTTHIVALSGYNITIVADAVMRTLAWLTIPFTASFWIAAAAVILFTLMTGASASVVRASVMGILVLIARKEGRMYSVKNALLFAGAVMLFQNPKILRFDSGFQLSFLATIGLVYFSPVVDEYYEKIKEHILFKIRGRQFDEGRRRRQKNFFLREIFISTLAAQVLVLPLLIHLFGLVSIISPVSNLFVLAAVPSAMFFSFVTGAGGMIAPLLGRVLAVPAWLLLQYEIAAIRFFAGLPMAAVSISPFTGGALALFYISTLGYALIRRNIMVMTGDIK